jgi:hypothetical protein
MGNLDNYTMNDLMLMIGACGIACSGILTILFRSKCKTIDLCCIKCVRDVDAVIKEERMEKGLPPITPKPKEPTLDLIEPEPEINI